MLNIHENGGGKLWETGGAWSWLLSCTPIWREGLIALVLCQLYISLSRTRYGTAAHIRGTFVTWDGTFHFTRIDRKCETSSAEKIISGKRREIPCVRYEFGKLRVMWFKLRMKCIVFRVQKNHIAHFNENIWMWIIFLHRFAFLIDI